MIHTRWYSSFSFLDGIGHPKKIVDRVKSLGMTSYALTEKWYMAWCIPTIQACQKSDPRLIPLVWVELGRCTDTTPKSKPYGTITFLAYSLDGLKACMKLCTLAHHHLIEGIPHLTTANLTHTHTHPDLIVLLGWHNTQLLHIQWQDIASHIEPLINTFGHDSLIIDFCSGGKKSMTDPINAKLREIKKRYNFSHVINNGFCYPQRDDHEIFCIGQAIKQGLNIRDIDKEQYHNRHLLSPEERETLARDYGFDTTTITQARATSLLIGSKSTLSLDFGKTKFPIYESPPHIQNLYTQYMKHV